MVAPDTSVSEPAPPSDPENVVPAGLDSVTVLLPVTVTVPLKFSGVLPPSATVPLVPPALVRLTALPTVVATLACTVPLTSVSAPVPRPVGLPMLSVPDSSVVPPV